MKLSEHTQHIKHQIHDAFHKYLTRLGIGSSKLRAKEDLPIAWQGKRDKMDELIQAHQLEEEDYDGIRNAVLDELTFTLFNRLAAIKVMEAHLLFPEIITKRAEHGDRSFGHKAWLEDHPDMRSDELEGLREYLKYEFNQLGNDIPLFHRSYPYALLPDTIDLNAIINSFNEVALDGHVGDDIWESDDVLGWLYESYNIDEKKKHKESKKKTEYHKVSLQSQVYTPRWVVQFLVDNSLGKLYLEMYPDSELRNKYKIANAPDPSGKPIRQQKKITEIRLIDPAVGSGNFLFYAFDLLYDMYMDQIENYGVDIKKQDIPQLIIENNLHGIDLDDRAIQIAQLGLYIKAKRKNRHVGSLHYNVVSSAFLLPEYEEVSAIFDVSGDLDDIQKDIVKDTWSDLQNAHKYGSLIKIGNAIRQRIEELKEASAGIRKKDLFTDADLNLFEQFEVHFFENLENAIDTHAKSVGTSFLTDKTKDAITFLRLLTQEYDVAVANPPYTDSSGFGPDLKKFIEANYKKPYKFHTNLYATFIKRCFELTNDEGKVALIHPHTFMFIKTFEDVRTYMIEKSHIDVMVDYGLDRVNLFGPGILLDATFYVLSKIQTEKKGIYFNLTTNLQEKYKKGKFLEALKHFISGVSNDRFYTLEQSKLKIIKSWPFIYWISDEFREKFGIRTIENIANVTVGINSGGNERFIRFWWEIDENEISKNYNKDNLKWVGYAKGGPFNKWFGNNWLRLNWEDEGHEVRNAPKSVMRNSNFYFKEGITYSASGSKGVSFRYLSNNNVFDVGGSSIFMKNDSKITNKVLLGFLNSNLSFYIIDCLNPTVNTQVGDLKRIPVKVNESVKQIIEMLVDRNINIIKHLNEYSIIEIEFKCSPLNEFSSHSYLNFENYLNSQILINESILNELIIVDYDLSEQDKAKIFDKRGESIGALPVSKTAKQDYIDNEIREFDLDNIREYIQALPEKEFDAAKLDAIEKEFPQLYQSNNDLEEFCIRHKINPINVWYWFKESNVIPNQRMHDLAMEFLADMIREILMEDDDGIIPLVPNAGEKILLERIEAKFYEKGFSSAQFASFEKLIGRSLPHYLSGHFFKELSDHLNLFMYLPKTPFIWHLTSGPYKGFECYLIIYKWNKEKLYRIRSIYIEQRERSLQNRLQDLSKLDNPSGPQETEIETIRKQLEEISLFSQKVDELLAEGYDPILDDGVGKNIAPLQKKGMLAYEVLNKGQLKKYLEADW